MSGLLSAVSNRDKPIENRPTCFGVQEINCRQEDGVHHSPDDPESPADVLNTDRCDFDDGEVCDPASGLTRD